MNALAQEYAGFLYASIGEEVDGMPVSVLSALARLDMDPWEMASQLTVLPRATSVPLLASLLERLPSGPSNRRASEDIALRLVELLPPGRAAALGRRSPREKGLAGPEPLSLLATIRLIAAFSLFALLGQFLVAGISAQAPGEKPAAHVVRSSGNGAAHD